MKHIGVIAFQGDYERHLATLRALGVDGRPVRRVDELPNLQGLIIPGGESTTIGMLMDRFGLLDVVRERITDGLPVMGTCAGAILLAREIEDSSQVRLGTLDIRIRRNAYGRQIDSFDASITPKEPSIFGASGTEQTLRGIFIRAPRIMAVGPEVETLALHDGSPVVVRSGRTLALTFHPELTDDHRLHRLFLDMTD